MITISLLFSRSKIDLKVKVPHVALAQKLILKHCAQCWRERHRKFERHSVVQQPLHHAQQRNVTLCYRLKEPVFFKEVLMLRMPNEWKMRMENKGEVNHTRIGNRKSETEKKKMNGCDRYLSRFQLSAIPCRYSVRQKSWKRSRPFLITSKLVA